MVAFILVGCGTKKEEPVIPKKSNEINNTIWIGSDGSEIIFEEEELKWYRDEGIHDDNYYIGTFEYYRGSAAIEFITTELSQYGITKSELENLFNRNEEYNEENFVVFNLVYSGIVMDGETTVPSRKLVPWYGFILKDGTYLDVANMNTGTYYSFTKKR